MPGSAARCDGASTRIACRLKPFQPQMPVSFGARRKPTDNLKADLGICFAEPPGVLRWRWVLPQTAAPRRHQTAQAARASALAATPRTAMRQGQRTAPPLRGCCHGT